MRAARRPSGRRAEAERGRTEIVIGAVPGGRRSVVGPTTLVGHRLPMCRAAGIAPSGLDASSATVLEQAESLGGR